MLLYITENINEIKSIIKKDETSVTIYPSEIPEIESKYEFLKALISDQSENDSTEYTLLLSAIMGVLSSLHYRMADYDKCREFVMEKMELDELLNNVKGLARCYSIIGNLYLDFGDIPRSVSMHLKRLEISRSLNDKKGIAISLTNIANAEMINKNFEESLKYNLQAIEVYSEISVSDSRYISLLGNLGQSYYFLNDYDTALKYFLKAIEIKKDVTDYSKSAILNMIGGVYADNEKYEQAFEYFDQALDSCIKLNDRNTELNTHLAIANTNIRLGNIDKAIDIIKKAIEENSELSNELIFSAHYHSLYECYKQKNDFENAFKYFSEFMKLEAITDLQSAERIISNLKNLHELENIKIYNKSKTLRNDQLRNTLAKLEKVNGELQKTNQEKNELLSIIAHDLRNPVSNVKLLADMNINNDRSGDEEKGTETELISSTCEDILGILNELVEPGTKESSYNKKYTSFDIIKLLKRSIKLFNLNTLSKNIEIKLYALDEEIYIKNDYRSVYQIIDNLLSNSIKFSPNGAKIEVKADKADNFIRLVFIDMAGGFSEDDISKYFNNDKTISVLNKDSDSERFGLSVVLRLLNNIHGKISCTNITENETTGSRIEVSIPDNSISLF